MLTAVVLAGGKGTRLRSVARDLPKPMVPVDGVPVLEHQLRWLHREGVRRVILLVGHRKEAIIDHVGDGSAFDLEVDYFVETEPLGTTGGVKAVEDRLDDSFLVLYGDVMLDLDLSRFVRFHRERAADASLVLHPNDHPFDSDLVEVDESDRVTAFHSKPHPPGAVYRNLVNAACYLFEPVVLDHIEPGVKADFGADVLPRLIHQRAVFGYRTPEYLKDMGTPDRLARVEADVRSGTVAERNLRHARPAIFLDRDGVINRDHHLIRRTEDMELLPGSASAVRRINRSGHLAVVVTNQSVIARNLVDLDGLRRIHDAMEWTLGEDGAYVDDLLFCPHHPDGGYPEERPEYKVACDCRKPSPGMLLTAADRWNIDLERSWMIGDSPRDAEAGRRAGCRTIGVRTGHGMDGQPEAADVVVDDLARAVHLILDDPFHAVIDDLADHPHAALFIGGNARTGKSTAADWIAARLRWAGESVTVVHLDDWLHPKPMRDRIERVEDRYDLDTVRHDLERLRTGVQVVRPIHDHSAADGDAGERTYRLPPGDRLIVEGVVAGWVRGPGDIFLHLEADEAGRRDRFEALYTARGRSADDIDRLYHHRLDEEVAAVNAMGRNADRITTFDAP